MEKDASNRFALYTPIQKVEPQGDGSLLVSGWGSVSNYIDSQGDFPDPTALKSAAIDWGTHWGNIRLQHDGSKPIGSARKADYPGAEISIKKHPDTGTEALWLVSHIVDADGINKVKSGTLKGYSMGGQINPGGRVLSELNGEQAYCLKDFTIDEVSLVDKPACNLATVEHVSLAKREKAVAVTTDTITMPPLDLDEFIDATKADEKSTILKFFARLFGKANAIMTAQKADDDSKTKPYGNVTYADPGYQEDGKKRYPIDTEAHVRAAWSYINMPKNAKKYSPEHLASIKAKIRSAAKKFGIEISSGKAMQVANLQKGMYSVAQLAELVQRLDYLVDNEEFEAANEEDGSSLPAKLAATRDQLGEILVAMVEEEVSEIADGRDDEGVVAMALSQKAQELLASITAGKPMEKRGKVMSSAMKGHLEKAQHHLAKAQAVHGMMEKAHKAADYSGMDDHLSNLEGHHDAVEKCHKAMSKMADEGAGPSEDAEGKAPGTEIEEVGTLEGKSAKLGDMIKAAVASSIEPMQKQLTELTTANAKLQAENETLKAVNKALGEQPAPPKARLFAVRPGLNADPLDKGTKPEEQPIDPKDPQAAKKMIMKTLQTGRRSIFDPSFKGSMTS